MASRPAAAQPSTAEHRDALSDAELAVALRDGQSWAPGEAWRRFAPMVRVAAERTLGSLGDSEDAMQETFIGVFRTVHGLREPERLRSFVYSVALRTLRTHLRSRRSRRRRGFADPATLIGGPDLTFDLDSRDLLRGLYDLLGRLSARDRKVFILRRVEA
ncbi:MAG TPA: sigma-70 family RNA polymerase sigma factor, partial [Polyangiaceae bacterium]|nr:sigma-70 family RNA polymerase sigma factor [Polyangiaceae bacterium]